MINTQLELKNIIPGKPTTLNSDCHILDKLNALKIIQISSPENISDDFPKEYWYIFQDLIQSSNMTCDDNHYYYKLDYIYKVHERYIKTTMIQSTTDYNYSIGEFEHQINFKEVHLKKEIVFTDEV